MNSKILMLIISTIYALSGVVFLGWDVFFIVYLFWFENFIRVISYRIKMNAVSYVHFNTQIIPAKDANGNFIEPLKEPFKTRLFFYFLYFVFIVIGLGLVFPLALTDKDSALNAIISFVSIMTFSHLDFNIALLLCIINEAVSYYKDFKINKIGTEQHPFTAPSMIEKEDIILHLSIIFTGFFAFIAKHPFFTVVQNNFTAASLVYIPAILVITMKFFAQLYDYKTKEQSDEPPISLSPEKEEMINRLKNL